jgi:hypothetical protein
MMKKFIVSVFLFVAFNITTRAQGNLQYNATLTLPFTINNTVYTIPSGKVWKIENVAMTDWSSFFRAIINNKLVILKNINTNYGALSSALPFWISGGQNITFIGQSEGVVSVIEFNVIP